MSEHIKINCPKCNGEQTVMIVGTVGSNVGEGGKVYDKGVAVTECELCGYMMQTEQEVQDMLTMRLAQVDNIKKVAINCDNYKVDKYLSELKQHVFTVAGTQPYVKNTTVILVECSFTRVIELEKLCRKIELHFKRGN